jgi:hypothetical protein
VSARARRPTVSAATDRLNTRKQEVDETTKKPYLRQTGGGGSRNRRFANRERGIAEK